MGGQDLKPAKIADIWRAVRKSKKRVLRRFKVSWSGIPRLTDGYIEIVRPITLICGENGAGKSSLLHALVHAVAAEEDHAGTLYCRPRDGVLDGVEIDVEGADGSITQVVGYGPVSAYFSGDHDERRLAFIDAGMHVPAILEFTKRDANFSDLLEGVDPVRFTEDELELARFIIGRNYSEILVFEIVDSSFGGVLPHFKVESQGASYETLDMGYGEIAVIYMLWALARVSSGALILIEEPETFLSPRAQTALVDAIARYVKERQLLVVMTSHSGAIAARMHNDEVIYTTRSSGRVTLHSPARTSDLVARLGLVQEKAFIFFVEDFAAEVFAKVLTDNYSDRLSGGVEYVKCDGEGNVLRALEVIPQGIRQVAHVGVLDGDQRVVYDGEDSRVVFLPGASPPETLLIELARVMERNDSLATLLDVGSSEVSRAAAHADGDELHNWIHTFARSLMIPYSEVLRRLATTWARQNRGPVEEFVRDIEKFSSANAD